MTYDPTTWNEGAAPGISAGELNRIEQGIVDAHLGPIIPELDASAHSNQYPDGKSYMAIFTASGWPESVGSVHTFVGSRGGGQRIWQMFFGKTSNIVYMRTRNSDDTAWEPWNELVSANVGNQIQVENSVQVASATVTAQTLTATTNVTLAIPGTWNSWACFAMATMTARSVTGTSTVNLAIRIDGSIQQTQESVRAEELTRHSASVAGRRTGMTTTGNRTVSLMASRGPWDVTLQDIFLYARAVRTS